MVLPQVRASGGEQQGVLHGAAAREGCGDRFALGVTAACLRLCRPFITGGSQHLARLSPEFLSSQAHR